MIFERKNIRFDKLFGIDPERLAKLNAIAISQMKVLTEDHRILQLDAADDTGKPEESLKNRFAHCDFRGGGSKIYSVAV